LYLKTNQFKAMVKIIYTTLFVTCLLFSSSVVAQYCNNNTDCSWRISPPGAGTITLSFTGVFDLELYNCSDKITVYDGADTTANVLDVLCGNSNLTPPAPITSTGGQMFVRFTSDVSYNNAGWNASYTTTIAPPVYCSGQSTLNAASGNLSY
jgi:hypothetical protein